LVVDRDAGLLYELFAAVPESGGASWHAGSGAIFDLNSNELRPATWTSADAAGLPILPGLVRYDEVVSQGVIQHALRFTTRRTRRAWFISGAPDPRWSDDDLSTIRRVTGRNFEVVRMDGLTTQ
jgi:hypothetical protein